jgi:hypothetical protein
MDLMQIKEIKLAEANQAQKFNWNIANHCNSLCQPTSLASLNAARMSGWVQIKYLNKLCPLPVAETESETVPRKFY